MQTFLPHPDLAASAAALDDRRLGKQRVETLQILRALHLEDYGWASHPAVTMWRGHTTALVAYGLAVVDEWVARGHRDTTRGQIAEFALPDAVPDPRRLAPDALPAWWGREDLHRSHRAALLRKSPEHYGDLVVDDVDEPYVWPPPPSPPPEPRPFSAWLVRAGDAEERAALVELGIVTLPAGHVRADARPKQRRQRATFTAEIALGDPVVLHDGDTLAVGEVQGLAVSVPSGGLGRRVAFAGGTLSREDLHRPWQLQDPRAVARLTGEPEVLHPLRNLGGHPDV